MQIICESKPLLAALNAVSKIVDPKSAMPALSLALFSFDDSTKTVRVSGKSHDCAMTRAVTADDVEECGAFMVEPRDLASRVSACGTGSVRLVVDGTKLSVFAQGTRRRFALRIINDESPIKELDQPSLFETSAAKLGDYVRSAMASVSLDVTRPHVNSMLLMFREKSIACAVSTNGHWLTKIGDATKRKKGSKDSVDSFDVLIGAPGLASIVKLCDELGSDEDISVDYDSKALRIGHASATLELRIVDAEFPPFEAVIPPLKGKMVAMPRARTRDMVSSAAVATNQHGGITIEIGDGELAARGVNPEKGEAYDVEAVTYGGDKYVAGFGGKYLADALSIGEDDEVEAYFADELSPLALKYADRIAVVMPMKL